MPLAPCHVTWNREYIFFFLVLALTESCLFRCLVERVRPQGIPPLQPVDAAQQC